MGCAVLDNVYDTIGVQVGGDSVIPSVFYHTILMCDIVSVSFVLALLPGEERAGVRKRYRGVYGFVVTF